VVQTLDRVIRDAESIPPTLSVPLEPALLLPEHGRAICEAAVTLAERSEAAAILAMTRGGRTARVLSGLRPRVPIVAVTDSQDAALRLPLLWGVVPVVDDFGTDLLASATRVAANLVAAGTIPPASLVVIVNVIPGFVPGMRLYRIPG
jgi:pyruvate kinase